MLSYFCFIFSFGNIFIYVMDVLYLMEMDAICCKIHNSTSAFFLDLAPPWGD